MLDASSSADESRLEEPPSLGDEEAWRLIRRLAAGEPIDTLPRTLANSIIIDPLAPHSYWLRGAATVEAIQLLDLFMPLCVAPRAKSLVVGHIAQSLDGRIATIDGESKYISGQEDLNHTHRLRAVCDAVIVGVQTILCDNPLLTTRLVVGRHPTRVVLDPGGKVPPDCHVLTDPISPTIIVTANRNLTPSSRHVRLLHQEVENGKLDLVKLLHTLSSQGMKRIFVEGGGITVSRFLEADLLHRLHLAIAPTILGSGRSSFELPVIHNLKERRDLTFTQHRMGKDVLLDCEFPGPTFARRGRGHQHDQS